MSGEDGARSELQRLSDRVETLQREQGELQREIAATQERVRQHERVLEGLRRGVFAGRKRGRFVGWFGVALLMIAAGVGYVAYNRAKNRPDTTRLGLERLTPIRPHLLLTSDPPGAAILVDGRRKGHTPLLLPAPRSDGAVAVSLRLPGRQPVTRTLQVKPSGGVHWHAELGAR